MRNHVFFNQVLVRFQEPSKFNGDYLDSLAEFTNYDGLVAEKNPIDVINVDIRSYCFDYGRVRKAMYKFIDDISTALNVQCSNNLGNITCSSQDVVGWKANEPIREVSYYIDICR